MLSLKNDLDESFEDDIEDINTIGTHETKSKRYNNDRNRIDSYISRKRNSA
jgi:hypothetical protein